VRAAGTGIDPDGEDLGPPPGQKLEVGHQAGVNAVADQVRDPLFHVKGRPYPADVARLVLHADQHRPARGVRESHQGSEQAVRRAQFPLELERLAFRVPEHLHEIHGSEVYSEVPETASLLSRPAPGALMGASGRADPPRTPLPLVPAALLRLRGL
jgi:hypothetical protein